MRSLGKFYERSSNIFVTRHNRILLGYFFQLQGFKAGFHQLVQCRDRDFFFQIKHMGCFNPHGCFQKIGML